MKATGSVFIPVSLLDPREAYDETPMIDLMQDMIPCAPRSRHPFAQVSTSLT
jgi:hypothetical protein